MEQANRIILEGINLSKDFNGNVVLKDVSICCREGRVIALIGENGAGKTTLMNIISGGLVPSSGEIKVDGKPVKFFSPVQAREKGIAFVHQELSLMEEMTIGENIMLGLEPKKGFWLDQKEIHNQAKIILNNIGFDLDVYKIVADLPPAEKQITEIAKAWASNPRIIILDEPTSSLNKAESKILFSFIERIKRQNVSVIMISHRMEDIFTTCDEAFVLRDGEFVFHAPISETNEDELISKMVGRDIKHAYPPKNTERNPDIRVSLRGACVGNRVRNVDIDIPVGSVVGIGGLEGQGQRELSRALFGIEPFTSGKYFIDSKEVKITSPRVAIKNKIAFVPDDRKTEGLVLPLSVESNIISLVLDKVSKWSLVKGKAVAREVYEGVEQLNIKIADPKQIIRDISGGNQQKIIFSKWIKTHPRILYLHEPTRGVDVQSKLEIYELIRKLTKTGVSVVIFSSDLLELIGLSDEIYVMYEGEISGHINGNEATEEKIMQLSVRKGTIKEGGIC